MPKNLQLTHANRVLLHSAKVPLDAAGRSGLTDSLRQTRPEVAAHKTFLPACLLSFLSVPYLFVAAAGQPRHAEFELYPADTNMGRTNLQLDDTRSARPIIMKRAGRIFQVLIDKRTGRELFRVDIGVPEASYWVYGLVREADFNGDGIPDFSWHGGDDTSELNLLALSSSRGYRKVDIDATLEREWRRRYPSDSRGDNLLDDPVFSNVKLVRTARKLWLHGVVHFSDASNVDQIRNYERQLRASEDNFVFVK